jgi:hypothetical protein
MLYNKHIKSKAGKVIKKLNWQFPKCHGDGTYWTSYIITNIFAPMIGLLHLCP